MGWSAAWSAGHPGGGRVNLSALSQRLSRADFLDGLGIYVGPTEAAFVHRRALKTAPQGFGTAVRAALELGLRIGAGEYLEALEFRLDVIAGLQEVLRECDALLLPAAPLPASKRGTSTVMLESGPQTHRNAHIELTAPFSLAGLPTLSLPFMLEDGLPVGLQVVGASGADARVLELGVWLEAWLNG